MANGWFVTGTDTGVGKTRAAQTLLMAAVRAGKRAVGMKPVATGCRVTPDGMRSEDAEALLSAGNVQATYADVNPYAFVPPVSPHLAAREAGVTMDLAVIRDCCARLTRAADCIVVEGAGGWFAPISDQYAIADIARLLGLPVILVVGMRLGCLNHALLTHEAICRSGLPFAGWIANHIDPGLERAEENLATLQQRLRVAPLAVIPHLPDAMSSPVIEQLKSTLIKSD